MSIIGKEGIMTPQGWRSLIDSAQKCERTKELLVKLLIEQDQGKQMLRDKGYGKAGQGWLNTIKLVPKNEVAD